MSQGTIVEAQQHVEAGERYPELGAPDASRSEALRLLKAWEAMMPAKRLPPIPKDRALSPRASLRLRDVILSPPEQQSRNPEE
jgi:hypothetical protein